MKKKLLISFLFSIAFIVGLCCFSGSALSDKPVDPVVINAWCSSKGIPSFYSSLTDSDLLFFCYKPRGAFKIGDTTYRNNYVCLVGHNKIGVSSSGYNYYVDSGYILQNYSGTAQWVNFSVTSIYDYSQWALPNDYDIEDYFSNYGIDWLNHTEQRYLENYTDYYNQYYEEHGLGNPFEDNNGLFFNTISSTMSTAYNSVISSLWVELSSIGLIPFLLFFLAISTVIVWFFGVVF